MAYYEVWGWDAFAREEYLCGRYPSRRKAEDVCVRLRGNAKRSQGSGLRDTFSVREVKGDDIKRQEREKGEQAMGRSYKDESLRECAEQLLKQFRELSPAKLEKGKSQKNSWRKEFRINWKDETDCFDEVSLRPHCRDNGRLRFFMDVSVYCKKTNERGKVTSSLSFEGDLDEVFRWADTKEAVEECVATGKELIRFWWERQEEHGWI